MGKLLLLQQWRLNSAWMASLLVTLLPEASAAPRKERPICPDPKYFLGEIYNCGQNHIAVRYAKECADTQLLVAQAKAAALQAVMGQMEQSEEQSGSMGDAYDRLLLAVNQFTDQVQGLQSRTELVASYTESMIDFPEGKDDASSAECFNTSFHALQKIVNRMDDEIIKAKAARQSAIQMLETLGGQAADLSSVPGSAQLPAPSSAAPTSPAAPPQGKDYRSSDVSGTEKLQRR